MNETFEIFDLNPIEYYYAAQIANQNLLASVRQELKPFETPNSCIIATGSHGKQESFRVSKIEIVLITDEKKDKSEEIKSNLQKFVRGNSKVFELGPGRDLEIKALNEQAPLSFVGGASESVYPDRVLNSYFLGGNIALYQIARRRVLEELSANNTQSRRIRRKMRTQIKDYRKTCRTGIFRRLSVFDPQSATAFYYEDYNNYRNSRLGVKVGPLRLIQRHLDLLAAQIPSEIEIDAIPTTTIERIHFYHALKLLDKPDDISEAYAYFLKAYHQLQRAFEQRPDKIAVVQFDQDEFNQHLAQVVDFSLQHSRPA